MTARNISQSFLPRTGSFCATLVIILAVLTLLGWTLGFSLLASIRNDYIPMAPSTALCFLGIGVGLVTLRFARLVSMSLGIIVLLVAGAKIAELFFGTHFGIDEALVRDPAAFGMVHTGRMSPITALDFVLIAAGICMLADGRTAKEAGPFGALAALASCIVIMGYLYGTPLLYGGTIVPVALTTALAFLLCSVAIMAEAGPAARPLRIFLDGSTRALLLRSFLPASVAGILVYGWIIVCLLSHTAINPAFTSAIAALLFALVVAGIISKVSSTVGGRIDEAEAARNRAQAELVALNSHLEQTVQERTHDLRDSEQRYKRLLGSVTDYIYTVKVEYGRSISTSHGPACVRVTGYTSEELGSDPHLWHRMVHEKDRASVLEQVTRVVSGDPVALEHRIIHKDGTVRWVRHTPVLRRDEQDRVVGYDGLISDITERKEAEERVRNLNEALEKGAAQLKIANEELESFSYSVSHDLRAPLRHVHGYVDLLKSDPQGRLSEKQDHYVKIISEASSHMNELIEGLLSFSRMGRTEMNEVVVDLDRLVRKSIANLEMATKGRNIVWKIAPLPLVLGDLLTLRQVFANLISNAVKYSRPRDPAEIELGHAGEEAGRIILFVRDNGVGFDPQYAHKLFGVFQRLHAASDFEGTGIGLANVQRIVARHGGRIWAEAKPGAGATFFFTLKPAAAR